MRRGHGLRKGMKESMERTRIEGCELCETGVRKDH